MNANGIEAKLAEVDELANGLKAEVQEILDNTKSEPSEPGDADKVLNKYSRLQITDSTEIGNPVAVIKINGEIIGSEGGIVTFSGAAKSGKTAATSVVMAGVIAPGEYDGFEGIEVTPANSKAVLHFDSEQARHKHQRNTKSILKRAGLDSCPPNFLSYNIRSEAIENYKDITHEICKAASEKFGGVHLIVIDGGADYIPDVNDPEHSNELVKFFEDLAAEFKTVVIVIVHVNPGSEKERGHFGSQLQRKSESILIIKSQGDISYIEPRFLRSAAKGDIPLIQFIYDKEKGYHVYCGVNKSTESNKADHKRLELVKKAAEDVFKGQSSYSYADAVEQIMKATSKQIATAKGYFTEMRVHDLIVQGEDKNWRLNHAV